MCVPVRAGREIGACETSDIELDGPWADGALKWLLVLSSA